MSKLIYIINVSLDGYVEDESGGLDWANPEQIHEFITDLVRPIETHLCGRKLYETMTYWDAPVEEYSPERRDFARVWQQADKVVFSRTLTTPTTSNARVERNFDPEIVRALKRGSEHAITVGGAELAGLALEAGLVDECHVFLQPVSIGDGKRAFPAHLRCSLELLETRRFDTGVIHARYRVRNVE